MKKPSVSQLIGLLDKPALLKWANKQGLMGIDIEVSRKKAMAEGTSLHKQIEMFHKGTGDFENTYDRNRFIGFIEDKNILDMEFNIETEWFVGRVDCVLEYNGKTFVTDFKKGYATAVYFEQKLQLAAYGMATGIDDFALINIPDFVFRPVVLKDFGKYEQAIITLSKLWNIVEELKK